MLSILKLLVPKPVAIVLDVLIFIGYFGFLVNYISVFADYMKICILSWGNISDSSKVKNWWIKLILYPIVYVLTCF